jgi:hypothetical protein
MFSIKTKCKSSSIHKKKIKEIYVLNKCNWKNQTREIGGFSNNAKKNC